MHSYYEAGARDRIAAIVDGFVETAWLHGGYANDPTFHGVQAVPHDTLLEVVRLANQHEKDANREIGVPRKSMPAWRLTGG